MPSNGVNTKIVVSDIGLLFEGNKINFSISEMVGANAKYVGVFADFLYLPSNSIFAKIVNCYLDLLLKVKEIKMLIT